MGFNSGFKGLSKQKPGIYEFAVLWVLVVRKFMRALSTGKWKKRRKCTYKSNNFCHGK